MKNTTPSHLVKNLHAHFIAKRVEHLVDVHSKFHPKVKLSFSILELDLLIKKRMKSQSFFSFISALTHALEGSITCGAKSLDVVFSSYGSNAIQLRIECSGNLSDPSRSEIQCQRLSDIESIVDRLGGEVACLYEPNRMQFDMVLPFAEGIK